MHTANVECIDVSGPLCDGSKLELTVVSPQFQGLPVFKRRQLVNDALNSLRCQPDFKSDIVTYNLL
jgi:stress-induced morphogen